MAELNGNESPRSPRVKRASRMLEQIPGDFDPIEFSTRLDQETVRELAPDQQPHEHTVPAYVYGPSGQEPEIVLWPLSLN